MYTATKSTSQVSNIQEIADTYHISKNHLMKCVHKLGMLGILETSRGRGGGIRLAKPPSEINVGWVVRHTEENLDLAECFNPKNGKCILMPACVLKNAFSRALDAYFQVLDTYSIADLVADRNALRSLLDQRTSAIET